MCGIVGIFSPGKSNADRRRYVDWCLKTMHRRGPDSNGVWNNENYITGFVRLSIRDLSTNANQPMLSACGNYCLTFNGEIYNVEPFRERLAAKGIAFKSTSDTEVLLYALIHFGIQRVLAEFDGMFAFAFYNQLTNELIVARDRTGIKPLYIGVAGGDIIYSSQYNHIINYSSIKNNSLCLSALGNYLQLGYVPDGAGMVEHTFLLAHGHYAVITKADIYITRYYDGKRTTPLAENNEEQVYRQSVQSQLVSNVPVGTFLSGGIDSPLISYWANQVKPVKSFTIGNADKQLDETESAKAYAKTFGIESFIQEITEKDLLDTLDDNTHAYSEPFGDFSSIPSLVVSKFASAHVKVVLSGDGPDELYWGYPRNVKMLEYGPAYFQSKPRLLYDYISSRITNKKKLVNFKRLFNSPTFSDYYFKSLFTYGGEEWISKIYRPSIAAPYFLNAIKEEYPAEGTGVDAIMQTVKDLEMNIHLQRILLKVDRASMYHSIEVRVPYLSNAVIDYSNSVSYTHCIVNGIGKYNLKSMLMKKVNPDLVLKPKKGFMIPMRLWLRKQIKKDVTDKLMNMPSEMENLFNRSEMGSLLKKHMDGTTDYSGILWALYTLVNWHHCHRNARY